MREANLEIQLWSEEEFFSNRDSWQRLLALSGCDQLFMSWSWMSSWWKNWGGRASDKLQIYAAYADGVLVGIAPLYISRHEIFKGLFTAHQLQFIGTRFKQDSGLRSEYLDFIVHPDFGRAAIREIVQHIAKSKVWDEFILTDVASGSSIQQIVEFPPAELFSGYRLLNSELCYAINCDNSFEKYLSILGKNTRLKLYNRREYFRSKYHYTIDFIDVENVAEIIEVMNVLHKKRFKTEIFSDKDANMISEIFSNFGAAHVNASSSILKVDGRNLSAILNLSVAGKTYNLQLGFEEHFDKKVSLGLLHLGHSIEDAFNNPAIKTIDFLAGWGKQSNYKMRFANSHTSVSSHQFIRKKFLRVLYFVNDNCLQKLKKPAGFDV